MAISALLLSSLLILVIPISTATAGSPTNCDEQVAAWQNRYSQTQKPSSTTVAAKPAAPINAIPLRLAAAKGSDSLEAHFNYRSKGWRTDTITLQASTPFDLSVDQFRADIESGIDRPDKETGFPDSQIGMAVEVGRDEGLVRVRVCIDPERPVKAAPGRYEGAIVVTAKGIEQERVPILLVIQDASWLRAAMVAFIGVLLGITVKVLSDLRNANTPSAPAGAGSTSTPAGTGTVVLSVTDQLRDYFKQPGAIGLLVMGPIWMLIAIAIVYMLNPTFGSSFMDWVKLLGFSFAVEVTGMTSFDAAQYLRSGSA